MQIRVVFCAFRPVNGGRKTKYGIFIIALYKKHIYLAQFLFIHFTQCIRSIRIIITYVTSFPPNFVYITLSKQRQIVSSLFLSCCPYLLGVKVGQWVGRISWIVTKWKPSIFVRNAWSYWHQSLYSFRVRYWNCMYSKHFILSMCI